MAINKKFNFTIKDINDLPLPEKGKRVYYYDTKTQGLAICVTSTKKKTFFVYRKIDGRPERIKTRTIPRNVH